MLLEVLQMLQLQQLLCQTQGQWKIVELQLQIFQVHQDWLEVV